MIVIDTSVIYALMDGADRNHARCREWYAEERSELATTPLVLAETDHLVSTRLAPRAAAAWRHDLRSGAYDVHWWKQAASESCEIAERYGDLGFGLTDASLVALASRLDTVRIATLDERHFRSVRPLSGSRPFRLLPIDR